MCTGCVVQIVRFLCGPATVHVEMRALHVAAAGDTTIGSAHPSPTAPKPQSDSSIHPERTPDEQTTDKGSVYIHVLNLEVLKDCAS